MAHQSEVTGFSFDFKRPGKRLVKVNEAGREVLERWSIPPRGRDSREGSPNIVEGEVHPRPGAELRSRRALKG